MKTFFNITTNGVGPATPNNGDADTYRYGSDFEGL